ncbi:hypothetical protein M3Y97_00728900 [Aphelenchoides bicaudatus]|nr:hypothetical protein M3Y97_00728900 [Aphelenchoides bicaudatus]
MERSPSLKSRKIYRSLDEAFEEIGRYGRYQLFCVIVIQYLCIPNAVLMTTGFFRLGGLVPDYQCADTNNKFFLNSNQVRKNQTAACELIRSCQNITITNHWVSIFQEFEWVCQPDYIGSSISSLLPILHLIAHFVSGHVSDYFGRKWLYLFGVMSRFILGLMMSLAPTWQIYLMFDVILHFLGVLPVSAAFSLVVETVHSKHRMVQGFAFQYSTGFIMAGIGAYLSGHWRILLFAANCIGIPGALLLAFFVESPRYLMQQRKYLQAAQAMNRIAWFNRKSTRFTAEDMQIIQSCSTSHAPRNKKYTVWHIFANYRLTSYSISQMVTGISVNILQAVVFFNIQDLAGNPFMNISLMGALRLWTPFIAILLETKYKKFGRKKLLVGSLAASSLCFGVMFVIDAFEYGPQMRVIGTGFVLLGYQDFVWIGYKLYTTELYPTVIRSIALSTFSIASQFGSIVGPQLIYIRKYWHSAPYLGVVIAMLLATFLGAIFLPETKEDCLQDTVHDAKRKRLAFEKPTLTNEREPLAKH